MLKYTGYRGEVRVGWISQGILLSQSSQPQRLLPSDSMTFSQDKTQVTENPSVVPRGSEGEGQSQIGEAEGTSFKEVKYST